MLHSAEESLTNVSPSTETAEAQRIKYFSKIAYAERGRAKTSGTSVPDH